MEARNLIEHFKDFYLIVTRKLGNSHCRTGYLKRTWLWTCNNHTLLHFSSDQSCGHRFFLGILLYSMDLFRNDLNIAGLLLCNKN